MCEAEASLNKRGLVKVSLANVLAAPDWRAERVTQARLGEAVEISGQTRHFYRVRVSKQERDSRGYPGWVLKENIALGQVPSKNNCHHIKVVRTAIMEQPSAKAKQIMMAYFGSSVEVLQRQGDWCSVKLPGRKEVAWIKVEALSDEFLEAEGNSLISEAKRFLGTPYLWGGMSVLGIDCSGLTYSVYERHGLILPRDADEQFLCGKAVEDGDLRGGDLLFFGRDEQRITHVGMYISDGYFIHASGRRGCSIMTLEESHRERHYLGARRIIAE